MKKRWKQKIHIIIKKAKDLLVKNQQNTLEREVRVVKNEVTEETVPVVKKNVKKRSKIKSKEAEKAELEQIKKNKEILSWWGNSW